MVVGVSRSAQVSEQVSELVSKRTSEQVSEQVSKRTSEQVSEEVSKQTSEPMSEQVSKPTSEPMSNPSISVDKNDRSSPLAPFLKYTKAKMNRSVNPCDDFYSYACGNGPQKFINSSTSISFKFKIDSYLQEMINISRNADPEVSELVAQRFAASCYNAKINNSLQSLMESYADSKLSDPNLKHWIELNFKFSDLGVYPFVEVKFSQNQISLKYLNRTKIDELFDYLKSFNIDWEMQKTKYEKFYENLKSLISEQNDEPRTSTVNDFIAIHQQDTINWSKYFEFTFRGIANYKNWKIHNYLKNTKQFNRFLNSAENQLLINHAKAYLVATYVQIFEREINDFPRDRNCLHFTKKYFQSAFVPSLIARTHPADWRSKLHWFGDDIKEAFIARIQRATWIDDDTKKVAKEKIISMRSIFGYQLKTMNRTALNIEYESLNISDDFFENYLILKRKEIADQRKDAIPAMAFSFAHYFPEQNIISIPLQYWQTPFNYDKFPDLMNFGGMTFLLAYEMAHAFNSENYKINEKGIEKAWWSEGSLWQLQQRFKCLREQNYSTQDLAEMIADNIGARMAYDGFVMRLSRENVEGNEKPIEGFDFNVKQFYFLQFAQSLATATVSDKLEAKVFYDLSEIDRSRVNGILRNMPEFSEAYQCAQGSAMNPGKQCLVL